MESKHAASSLSALGHEGRLAVFRLLARRAPDGVRPSEIADALGMKRNTLSIYLGALEQVGLVHSRREGKSVHYGIDLTATGGLIDYLAADCCQGRLDLCVPGAHALLRADQAADKPGTKGDDGRWNVLFVCSGNSARSIFAEALMNKKGKGRFRAFSAGTSPASKVNPKALHVLKVHGHDVDGLRAKHIDAFRAPDAPHMDFVFTVCDSAANEECAPWAGQPITGHWGIPDPVTAEAEPGGENIAFHRAYGSLERRIALFLDTPLESLERRALQKRVDDLAIMSEDAPISAA